MTHAPIDGRYWCMEQGDHRWMIRHNHPAPCCRHAGHDFARAEQEGPMDSPRTPDAVRHAVEVIGEELRHYDLSDDPGYIRVPTERVRAILVARLQSTDPSLSPDKERQAE